MGDPWCNNGFCGFHGYAEHDTGEGYEDDEVDSDQDDEEVDGVDHDPEEDDEDYENQAFESDEERVLNAPSLYDADGVCPLCPDRYFRTWRALYQHVKDVKQKRSFHDQLALKWRPETMEPVPHAVSHEGTPPGFPQGQSNHNAVPHVAPQQQQAVCSTGTTAVNNNAAVPIKRPAVFMAAAVAPVYEQPQQAMPVTNNNGAGTKSARQVVLDKPPFGYSALDLRRDFSFPTLQALLIVMHSVLHPVPCETLTKARVLYDEAGVAYKALLEFTSEAFAMAVLSARSVNVWASSTRIFHCIQARRPDSSEINQFLTEVEAGRAQTTLQAEVQRLTACLQHAEQRNTALSADLDAARNSAKQAELVSEANAQRAERVTKNYSHALRSLKQALMQEQQSSSKLAKQLKEKHSELSLLAPLLAKCDVVTRESEMQMESLQKQNHELRKKLSRSELTTSKLSEVITEEHANVKTLSRSLAVAEQERDESATQLSALRLEMAACNCQLEEYSEEISKLRSLHRKLSDQAAMENILECDPKSMECPICFEERVTRWLVYPACGHHICEKDFRTAWKKGKRKCYACRKEVADASAMLRVPPEVRICVSQADKLWQKFESRLELLLESLSCEWRQYFTSYLSQDCALTKGLWKAGFIEHKFFKSAAERKARNEASDEPSRKRRRQ